MPVRIKRVYEPPDSDDGLRLLVDRVWPRGLKKESVQVNGWPREVAPSTELRRWFGHEPGRWPEFRRRYFAELDQKQEVWRPLAEAAARGTLTLVYGARDQEHNQAVALKEYLEARSRG